jgi:hypothetical protein
MKPCASLPDFALDGDLYASRSSSMRKAVHHLRRLAIKRSSGPVARRMLSSPAVFDGIAPGFSGPWAIRTNLVTY